MKNLLYILIAVLSINNAYSQLFWVGIRGETQFCPDDIRELTYELKQNYNVTYWTIGCKRCEIKSPIDNQWYLPEDFIIQISQPPSTIPIRWDAGNFDDAWIEYIGWTGTYPNGSLERHDKHYVTLVENDPVSLPNVNPTISSSVSSIACGSTSSITFTANWKNATSYRWDIDGGSISGCSTCATITVIPSATSTTVKAFAEGYNAACGVYSPKVDKTVSKTIPTVSAIIGPDEICSGAPSVVNHYVTPHIFGALYDWTDFSTGYTIASGSGTNSVSIQGSGSGTKQIKLLITACNTDIRKSKSVNSSSSGPDVDLSEDPEEACAGDCLDYQMEAYIGYAVGYQYRYNYGFWEDAYSDGSFELCTSSGDNGWNTLELRGEGICGNYGDITEWQILLNNCFYMMVMTAEDSLTMSSLSAETEDVILYPNPATTTMNVSLPDESIGSEIAIINDKNEIITRFKNRRKLFALDAGKLIPGYYYFIAVNKDKKISKRFLVK